jgi:hypothetical protein
VRGVPVTLREDTDYPFRNSVVITVELQRPTEFPIQLRIPVWAETATITVNGAAQPPGRAGSFARIEREWQGGDCIEVAFASKPRAVAGPQGETSFEQGPLVFALPIEERWSKLRQRGLTADWEILPVGAWAYAATPANSLERIERPVGSVPFSRRNPAVVLVTQLRSVTNWSTTDGSADPVPAVLVIRGVAKRLTLLPYGAPKLRVTAFPTVRT